LKTQSCFLGSRDSLIVNPLRDFSRSIPCSRLTYYVITHTASHHRGQLGVLFRFVRFSSAEFEGQTLWQTPLKVPALDCEPELPESEPDCCLKDKGLFIRLLAKSAVFRFGHTRERFKLVLCPSLWEQLLCQHQIRYILSSYPPPNHTRQMHLTGLSLACLLWLA
jgi:hypothetical protein